MKLILKFGYVFFFVRPFLPVRRKTRQTQSQEKEDKLFHSQIFHFDESLKSRQRILIMFGLLLLFYRMSFTNIANFIHLFFNKSLLKV